MGTRQNNFCQKSSLDVGKHGKVFHAFQGTDFKTYGITIFIAIPNGLTCNLLDVYYWHKSFGTCPKMLQTENIS
jgi:hypothetical protein